MEKIKEIFKDKNKVTVCIVGIAIVALIIILVLTLGSGTKDGKENKVTNKADLEKRLKELGDAYYEKYYGLLDDDQKANFLPERKEIGIQADLVNIAATVDFQNQDKIVEEFTKSGRNCDKNKTMVMIYPQEPFGVKDYKMEINLACDK